MSSNQLEIKDKFESILSGIYQIICRIKLDKNDQFFRILLKKLCREDLSHEKCIQYYFCGLSDYGTDCQCDESIMNYDWFQSNYLLYGNTNWFNQTMGQIKILPII